MATDQPQCLTGMPVSLANAACLHQQPACLLAEDSGSTTRILLQAQAELDIHDGKLSQQIAENIW